MKYENASEVLPKELLKELQKYAAGKLLYIPSGDGKKAWGETSGYRDTLKRRNRMICNKYAHGITLSELADEYFLSLDSIKKIIYSRKNEAELSYAPTVVSAVQFADAGLMEEWVQCYLLFARKDAADSHNFIGEDDLYFGVVKLPLRLIQWDGVDAGIYRSDEYDFVETAHSPLIVHYEKGKFYSIVQKGQFAALKQRKVNAYPTIVVLKGNADYKLFMKHFGKALFFVDQV